MKKVCIVITSLANGGTERFGATLSYMLKDLGYEVHLLSTKDHIEYSFTGELFNLEKATGKGGAIKKLSLLINYFQKHKFDIIIDNRARRQFIKEFFIYRILYRRSRVFSMVHNYNIFNYFPGGRLKSDLVYRKNNEFIGVSQGIKERIQHVYGYQKVHHIYNPIDIKHINSSADGEMPTIDNNYILYFGRFEEQSKNLTLLINAYEKSTLSNQNIKLFLLGKGEDEAYLKQLVEDKKLNDYIIFQGYYSNPFSFVKNAMFTVLSSNYEGFPMSIIESLALGTPVVSVDCESGPSEIIVTGKNGILVKNNDIDALSDVLYKFVNDKEFYKTCKKGAIESVEKLDVGKIKHQWYNLIEYD